MKRQTQAMLTMMITAASLVGCGKLEKAATSKDVRDSNNTTNDDEKPIDAGQISAPGSIAIDLQGAVALALTAPSASLGLAGTSGSNLFKVNPDGSLTKAFTDQNVNLSVSQIFVKSGHTFLLFDKGADLQRTATYNKKTKLVDCWDGSTIDQMNSAPGLGKSCPTNQPKCYFAWVDDASTLNCVDYGFQVDTHPNQIQFDGAGNVYYLGYFPMDLSRKPELRKVKLGDKPTTVAIAWNFAVNSKGDLAYKSIESSSIWTTIFAGVTSKVQAGWVQTFPDDKFYSYGGGLHLLTSDGLQVVKDKVRAPAYSETPAVTPEGKIVTTSIDPSSSDFIPYIVEYYPTYQATKIKALTSVKSGLGGYIIAHDANLIVMSGLESKQDNLSKVQETEKLILFNIETNAETNILPQGGVSVTSISVDAKNHVVHFAGKTGISLTDSFGLDSGDVVGSIDLNTLQVTTKASTVGAVQSIQTYSGH